MAETRQQLFEEIFLKGFDIQKYSVARGLDERGWSSNLRSRKFIQGEWVWTQTESVIQHILYHLDNPVGRGNEGTRDGDKLSALPVEDLNVMSAWSLQSSVIENDALRDACEAWDVRMNSSDPIDGDPTSEAWWAEFRRRDKEDSKDDHLLFGSFDELVGTNVGQRDFAHVQINMAAPDEVLVSDFKRWLAEKRASDVYVSVPVRKFTAADFARWTQKRVLAYLDVTLAARFFRVPMPFHKIGALLYPDLQDVDVAEKVRKTVAPLAEEMMTYEFLAAIGEAANAKRAAIAEGIV